MDATSVTDIQYAIFALQDLRYNPVKYLRGCMVPRRSYWSKLDAIQGELRSLTRSLETLSGDDEVHMVDHPRWTEVAVSKIVAARAKSSVNALDNAVNHLRKDIDRGPAGMSTNTKSILEGARTWNDSLLDMLDDVTPRDGNTISLNHSNLLSFYDTMWNLESEIAEIGTHLVVTSGGMTLGSSKVLKAAAINPPAKLTPDHTLRGEHRSSKPSPSHTRRGGNLRTFRNNVHPRQNAHHHTPEINSNKPQYDQAIDEASPLVSPLTKSKGQRGLHHAKDSLDLKFKFPGRFNPRNREPRSVRSRVPVGARPSNKSPPRYTQAPHPHQVPLPDDLDEYLDYQEHPDVLLPGLNKKPRRNAITSLNKNVNQTRQSCLSSTHRRAKVHSHHISPPLNAPKLKLYDHPRPRDTIDRKHPPDGDPDPNTDSDTFPDESIFTIDSSLYRELRTLQSHRRRTVANQNKAHPARPRSPSPSSSISQQPKPKRVTPPPKNDSKNPRRTLPEIVIETATGRPRGRKYCPPTVEAAVESGSGEKRCGKMKEISPTTTTLEALKALERADGDREREGRKRAGIAEWREGV